MLLTVIDFIILRKYSCIAIKFGMEGGDQLIVLASRNNSIIDNRKHIYPTLHTLDIRCADECHWYFIVYSDK